jgi:signal transduction histidine kinase
MKGITGLRRRWLVNTISVVAALALVCVFLVTAVFALYYYSNLESGLWYRAESTADFIEGYLNLDYNEFYQSCVTYAQTFEDRDKIELQFINTRGQIVSSSYGQWAGPSPETPEIQEAMDMRTTRSYLGKDSAASERILAVSTPMIYTNGEVIGVLRFVTSTRLLDSQVLRVGLVAFGVFAVFIAVILLFSNLFIRSVLESIREITAKAKRIAGGSYGVQIEIKNEDELGELAETINELSVQISQNEKAQTEFISSLSHELRTPLTAINGWGETLLSGGGLHTKEAKRGMQIIVRETQRLTEMVVSLLDFTRMQDGRMTLNVEPTDIRAEFEDTVYMYSSRLQQEGILLEYQDTDEEIEEIPCDGKRMRQVFLNILDNAAKHGGDGGRIDASISQEDGFVVVRIRDYGHGIPEDELPLVKHRFYKGSTKARGTGIGLAVSDEIVLLHGGELLLSNAPGGGTLVTVRLPVHP